MPLSTTPTLDLNALFVDTEGMTFELGDGCDEFITFTPDSSDPNLYTLSLNTLTALACSVDITANDATNPPVIRTLEYSASVLPVIDEIDPQSISEGQTVNIPLTATDPSSDALIFTSDDLPDGLSIIDTAITGIPSHDIGSPLLIL